MVGNFSGWELVAMGLLGSEASKESKAKKKKSFNPYRCQDMIKNLNITAPPRDRSNYTSEISPRSRTYIPSLTV